MRDKNRQILTSPGHFLSWHHSHSHYPSQLRQLWRHKLSTELNHWTLDTTSDTSALSETWILHFLIYFVRGSEEAMIGNNAQKDFLEDFCVVSNFLYQFIFLCKVSQSNKSWEYGGVKLFYFWRNPFFIKLSRIKLLKYFCCRVSPDASSQVWMFG